MKRILIFIVLAFALISSEAKNVKRISLSKKDKDGFVPSVANVNVGQRYFLGRDTFYVMQVLVASKDGLGRPDKKYQLYCDKNKFPLGLQDWIVDVQRSKVKLKSGKMAYKYVVETENMLGKNMKKITKYVYANIGKGRYKLLESKERVINAS